MLPVQSAAEIIDRLEQERSYTRRPALAFDADGTLWSGDIGIEVFESLLARRALREKAEAPLEKLASCFGIAKADEPTEQASLLYQAFLDGKLPEDLAFAMMAWAFAGFSKAELDAFVADWLLEAHLEKRMQRELSPILAWAEKRNVPIYVVSASPRAVVLAAIAGLGLRAEVLAMTPALSNDEVEPWVEEPIPYGAGKVAAFARAAGAVELLGAFGDTTYDAALLSRALVPVAVRPKPSLIARAGEVRGLVRLAEIF